MRRGGKHRTATNEKAFETISTSRDHATPQWKQQDETQEHANEYAFQHAWGGTRRYEYSRKAKRCRWLTPYGPVASGLRLFPNDMEDGSLSKVESLPISAESFRPRKEESVVERCAEGGVIFGLHMA
jgi:hypothetical protein